MNILNYFQKIIFLLCNEDTFPITDYFVLG